MIHIINLTYLVSPEEIKEHMDAHKAWVRTHSDLGRILLSGPNDNGGATIITADLDEETLNEFIEGDPWKVHNIASFETSSFTAKNVSPGIVTTPEATPGVFLVNVATTDSPESSIDALSKAVEHVSSTAAGFQGSRLLTSTDGDAIINLAAWSDEEAFNKIFEDQEFLDRYNTFGETTTGAKYRLYRTSRVISPSK